MTPDLPWCETPLRSPILSAGVSPVVVGATFGQILVSTPVAMVLKKHRCSLEVLILEQFIQLERVADVRPEYE